MKAISLNSLGTIVAMVVSAVSMLFTWQQMEIAKDQTHLSRKSLLIDKKLQVCLDFLTTASEFEFSFSNQNSLDKVWWQSEDQNFPKSGTAGVFEAMKTAGYLSNPTENSASELAKITARARLLLRAATAEKMQQYANDANKAYSDQILRVFKGTGNKPQGLGGWSEPLPASEVAQLNALRITAGQIETLCGELAEREAS